MKETFEPDTFVAKTFACGTFRGVGSEPVEPEAPTAAGLEYTVPICRFHYTVAKD